MKTTGATAARLGFTKLWRLQGAPTLRIVAPIPAWITPMGVIYDANHDKFVFDGQVIPVAWHTQPALVVGFLVNQSRNAVSLEVVGLTTTAGLTVTVLWSADVQAAIQSCWGIGISNVLYRVQSWEVLPLGVTTPTEIRLELSEGN